MAGREGTTTPQSGSTSWTGFIKSISSFSGDLSSLTAPPFILSPTSLTEYSAYWVSDPALLVAPASISDPEQRAVAVLKWFISTLKQQYSSRNEKMGSEKKPLNPFLGELFLAKWPIAGTESALELASEQVSHHPPVTAYNITDTDKTVKLTGYNGQKASVSKTLAITIKQVGHAILEFPKLNESYLITLPALHIEGLVSGSPYVELDKHTYVVSSTGFVSKISYSGKGWLSGSKNSFTANTWHKDSPKKILYAAEGQWTGSFHILDSHKKEVASHDPATVPHPTPVVADIASQDPLESRRAWQKVAEGVKKGDMDLVGHEKTIIEESQRQLRKREKEEGREWTRRYFDRLDKDPVFERLASCVGEQAEPDKTGGIWVAKATKAL
ncbi:Oxysterol-binding protein [Microthyrium microscopicum]|uniref:Oxysterol-binding protein n=1 Tax=Microthyrium microscopicum TaxID=703497 RepID=A0A6A6ULZ2_9PEZI|nr:Oxysterol-binding protein [Microthyrium microscopicum]